MLYSRFLFIKDGFFGEIVLLLEWFCNFYSFLGSEIDENDNEEHVEVARDNVAIQQLLTHVPDIVIKCDHKKQVPYVEQFRGVCLFADISG